MAESLDYWRRIPPPPFLLDIAVRDPLRHLSLAAWGPLASLRRGAQFGPIDTANVWCIGTYRFPDSWRNAKADRRRLRAGPMLLINPEPFTLLARFDGDTSGAVAERLAQLDLLVPGSAHCLTYGAHVPGSGRVSAVYALRGEIAFLESAPAGVLALVALARSYLAGWYDRNPPASLHPQSDFRAIPPDRKAIALRKAAAAKAKRSGTASRPAKRELCAPQSRQLPLL
jgi:hypothetical protein